MNSMRRFDRLLSRRAQLGWNKRRPSAIGLARCARRLRLTVAAALAAALLAAPFNGASAAFEDVLGHYYEMKSTDPDAAYRYLLDYKDEYSSDIRVQLEIGYYLLQQDLNDQALPYFEAAVLLDPERADLWKQLGYIRSNLGQDGGADEAFARAQELSPADEEIGLQRAYLLQRLGRNRESAALFKSLSSSASPQVLAQSCRAYSNLRGVSDKTLPDPLFAEGYFAPEYNSHWDLGVVPLQLRLGTRLAEAPTLEAYAGLRASADTRSGGGAFGSQVYNDNAAVLALGLRVRPAADAPLSFFVGAGGAYDITYRNRDRRRGDLRGGFQFFEEWNMAPPCGEGAGGIRLVADLYADGVYYSRYDDNVLFFVRARPGLRLIESEDHALDLFAHLAANFDASGIRDNNYEELGLGIAFRFIRPAGLALRAEGIEVFRHEDLESYSTFRARLEYLARF